MGFLKVLGRILMVTTAALLGNIVGDQVRAGVTDGRSRMVGQTASGNAFFSILPTNLLPAIVLGLLFPRQRLVVALISGMLLGGLLSDRYEEWLQRYGAEAIQNASRARQ